MKFLALATASVALIMGSAAQAQTVTEARCIVLSNVFAKEGKDEQAKKLAEAALYFYLGRLSPQVTSAQLKTALDSESRTITDANAGTMMGNCVRGFQKEFQLLQDIAGSAPKPVTKPTQPEGR